MCTLPFCTSITSNSSSFYVVKPADFTLPNHTLNDTATLTWRNLCNGEPPGSSCNAMVDQFATAGSSVTTQVLDASNGPFIQGIAPATVHALATITSGPGFPPPTGQVVFEFFTNANCASARASTATRRSTSATRTSRPQSRPASRSGFSTRTSSSRR